MCACMCTFAVRSVSVRYKESFVCSLVGWMVRLNSNRSNDFDGPTFSRKLNQNPNRCFVLNKLQRAHGRISKAQSNTEKRSNHWCAYFLHIVYMTFITDCVCVFVLSVYVNVSTSFFSFFIIIIIITVIIIVIIIIVVVVILTLLQRFDKPVYQQSS